jgi:hypothetical protein
MRQDQVIYESLVSYGKKTYKGFDVKIKDDSRLMKLIAKILFFNPNFMNSFVTTIGPIVYIPRLWFTEAASGNREYPYEVIAHELVHVNDSEKSKLFKIGYLFPQWLALIALLAPIFATFFGANWWLLLWALVFILPIPAIWRNKYERRGYAMSLAVTYWKTGKFSLERCRQITEQFTGPAYYFMWPFKKSMEKWTDSVELQLMRNTILNEKIYRDVHNTIKDIILGEK